MTDLLGSPTTNPEVVVRDGEVLIEEGTTPDRMFVLVSGQVVIEHDGVPFARVDTPGAVFGEMSAVLGPTGDGDGAGRGRRPRCGRSTTRSAS